jgi:transketolase
MTTDTYVDFETFKKGAYVVKYEKIHVDRTLIATGSEVSLALEIASLLEERGLDVRVVSMPSTNLFDKLSKEEQLSILGTTRDNIYSLELGTTDLWYKYAHQPFGVDTFGYSGKFDEILDYIGFNAETLADKIS